MRNISELNTEGLPSSQSLIKGTLIAFVVAILLLVTTILPAEYAIDPTGLGEKMGLTMLSSAEANEAKSIGKPSNLLDATLGPIWKSETAYRTDTTQLTLQPGQGAEIKSKMKPGDNFVFSWKIEGGVVSFDMHGEPPNAGNEFTSFWVGRNQSTANGSFDAPFEGTHGWYWKNNGTTPVTVHLTLSGFYDGIYRP